MERFCYTFENRCIEGLSLDMGDESRSIFLSTEGKDAENIPKELRAFFEFVKENRKLERSFMSLEDVRRDARLEGRLEGKREAVLELLEELGEIPAEVKRCIISETRVSALNGMLKAASGASSFCDFKEKIGSVKYFVSKVINGSFLVRIRI